MAHLSTRAARLLGVAGAVVLTLALGASAVSAADPVKQSGGKAYGYDASAGTGVSDHSTGSGNANAGNANAGNGNAGNGNSGIAHAKVILCHATSSATNPFVRISVNIHAAGYRNPNAPDRETGHDGHERDIIPPYHFGSIHYAGQNWDAAGQAIWNNGCQQPGPSNPPSNPPSDPPHNPPHNPPSSTPTPPIATLPPTDTNLGGGSGGPAPLLPFVGLFLSVLSGASLLLGRRPV